MLKAGDRIGDWIIDRPLGEGGMGAVYRVHSALSERVEAALKVMKPSMEPDARARFVREAEALSALRHPAIVRVMGFSEEPTRGLLYIVMELATGETLKKRMEKGPMGVPEALATFVPLAGALEHAHAEGIFHRDLKPSNVVLTTDGPRLVDFGIAAATAAAELTGSGHLGTLSYLPPEVFRGERAEPRMIDIYAFGLLLNEALTGHHPFPVEPGMTPAAAAATVGVRKLQHPALDPGEGAPQAIRDLVKRATDPDPKRRPEMAEMSRVLSSLVERRAAGVAAAVGAPPEGPPRMPAWSPAADRTMRVPDPVGPYATSAGDTSRPRRRFRERRRSVIYAWVASMLAAALLASLIIMMVRGSGAGSPEATASPSPSPLPSLTPMPAAMPPRRAMTSPRPAASPIPSPSASATPGMTTYTPRSPSPSARPAGAPAAAPPPATTPRPAPPTTPAPTPTPEGTPPAEPSPTPPAEEEPEPEPPPPSPLPSPPGRSPGR